MKHGLLVLTFAVASAAAVARSAEMPAPSIVYRGRLALGYNSEASLTDVDSKTMTFRGYYAAGDDVSVCKWKRTIENIPVSENGSFEAVLTDEALRGLVQSNLVHFIGVTIGNAGREAGIRRELIATPLVARSETAAGLSGSPKVGRFATDSARIQKTLSADDLSLRGGLQLTNESSRVTAVVAPVVVKDGSRLSLRGGSGGMLVFEPKLPDRLAEVSNPVVGQVLAKAPSAGVAYLHDDGSGASGVRLSGISVFCDRNDDIVCPVSVKGKVEVRFFSYRTASK